MKKAARIPYIIVLFGMTFVFLSMFSTTVSANGTKTEVIGNIYEFSENSHYEFHESDEFTKSNESEPYGTFSISGDIANVSVRNGAPAYEVSDGNLELYYNYGDAIMNADIDSWHLVEDKSKTVADMTMDLNIMNGTIIIQTSKDRKNWVGAQTITNAFSDVPIRTTPIYSTADVQLINGCFYRVVVVYQLQIRTKEGMFSFTDKYDGKKCAEVYEFYAYAEGSEGDAADSGQTYNLGSRVRVKNFDGYSGEGDMDKNDPHYGWDLGHFFVSGYSDEVVSGDEIVFLKNVGDKVTLWFRLDENINALRGNEELSVTADKEGYDQYFETPRIDFGRGALIIRHTDNNNVSNEPQIYSNYLEANTSVGADTKVQLFEEGDYEVALDYQITSDRLIDKIGHYRIFFKFSVRNGNCMAYPFDVATGSELTNSSMTENGFRLDLAMSRYLKVNVKREILKDGADGLTEDTRFNGPARDGAVYTDEGIYTITVQNEYTGQLTVKKIYVGTNKILRAYITTGYSIPKINALLEQGAEIADDGTIQTAVLQAGTPTELPTESPSPTSEPEQPKENETELANSIGERSPGFPVGVVVSVCVVMVVAIIIVVGKKWKSRNNER